MHTQNSVINKHSPWAVLDIPLRYGNVLLCSTLLHPKL